MSFKSARYLLCGGHERVDRRMLQISRERGTVPMDIVDEAYEKASIVHQSALEQLPRDIQLFIFGYMAIDDLNELTLSSRFLRYELVEPYLRSINKFIAEEQDGKLLNLVSLLMRNPCLESLIIDTKLIIAGGPGYFRSHSFCLAKCFKMLNAASLTTLILKGCVILNQDSMTAITNEFHNLTALDLSYMHHLKDSMLKKILTNNPHLVYLCLEKCYNAVNVYSVFYLPDLCPLLKTVSFSYCSNVDDACIQALGRLQHLQELSLAHCYDISSAAMTNFCNNNKTLTILSLEWCFNMDDDFLVGLSQSCSKLQILGMEHCGRFSDDALGNLIAQCPSLQFLSIDGCNQSSKDVASALKSKSQIRDLFLNTCNLITDECVKMFIHSCYQLVSLGIEECSITDETVKLIASFCPNLRVLGLNGNVKVTDVGIQALIMQNPLLQKLYVSDTAVSGKGVGVLAQFSRDLHSLSLVGCQVNLMELMLLGDPKYRCSQTLEDLHLSSAQYSAYFLQATMHLKPISKTSTDVMIVDDSDKENHQPIQSKLNVVPEGVVDIDEGAPIDLRRMIFVNRTHGLPEHRCCRIYYR